MLAATDNAKDANEVCTKIVGSVLQDGSITVAFERKGGGEGDILSLSTYETASKVCSFASSRLLGWITYFFVELKWFGG